MQSARPVLFKGHAATKKNIALLPYKPRSYFPCTQKHYCTIAVQTSELLSMYTKALLHYCRANLGVTFHVHKMQHCTIAVQTSELLSMYTKALLPYKPQSYFPCTQKHYCTIAVQTSELLSMYTKCSIALLPYKPWSYFPCTQNAACMTQHVLGIVLHQHSPLLLSGQTWISTSCSFTCSSFSSVSSSSSSPVA